MHLRTLPLALLVLLSSLPAQIVVNEVNSGSPDFVELANCSGTAVDVSGWTVATSFSNSATNYTLQPTFTMPPGTVIPAGGFLVLEENGLAGAAGTLPASIRTGFNYPWVSSSSIEVWILDAAGQGVDYMHRNLFGAVATPNMPAPLFWSGTLQTGLGDVIARMANVDTNDASDWVNGPGLATPGTLNPSQSGIACAAPTQPWFQTNTPEASLDIDGVQSSGFAVARTSTVIGNTSRITLDSMLTSTLFEVAFNVSPLVRGDQAPGLRTLGGQNVNLDFTDLSSFFLWGGANVAPFPFLGTIVTPVASQTPIGFSAQGFFLNPSHPDGLSLTQGVEYATGVYRARGPSGDDSTSLLDLPALGLAPVQFLGGVYSQVGISSNGRITFGGVDADLSPSVSEAQSDLPFVGYWTDLNPASAGTIDIVDDGRVLTVRWNGVPYFAETATVDFSVEIDRVTPSVSITNLTGIAANPMSNGFAGGGDDVFFGASPGSASSGGSAVDLGSRNYVIAGSQLQTTSDDMLYEFFDAGLVAPGGSAQPISLLPGNLNRIDFRPFSSVWGWFAL